MHRYPTSTSPWNLVVCGLLLSTRLGNMKRYYNIGDEAGENRFAQFSFSGEEYTGSIRHRILGGGDFGNKKFWGDFRSGNPDVRFAKVIKGRDTTEPVFNIYAPIYGLHLDSIPVFDRSMNIRQRAGSGRHMQPIPIMLQLIYRTSWAF